MVVSEKITLPIAGMTCAACQARVQRALTRAPGVQGASVNLLLNSATVDFDPAATSPSALVDVVRATGYDAELPAAGAAPVDESDSGDSEFRDLLRKAAVSATLGFS